MRRVALFMEGQTEQILVRHIIQATVNSSDLGFQCLRISGRKLERVPYRYGDITRKIYVLLINVGNDESVISAVRDRKQGLAERGLSLIHI